MSYILSEYMYVKLNMLNDIKYTIVIKTGLLSKDDLITVTSLSVKGNAVPVTSC